MAISKLYTSFTWKPKLEIVKFVCISLQQSISNFWWKHFGHVLPKNKMLFDIPLESFDVSFSLFSSFCSISFMLEVFESVIFVKAFVQRNICFSFFIIAFQFMDSNFTAKFTSRLWFNGFRYFWRYWGFVTIIELRKYIVTRSWGWVTNMENKKVVSTLHGLKLSSFWDLHSLHLCYGITGYGVSRPGIQN